nr:hypothetical protein [Tanacetum cinerariifolium]
MCAKMVLEEEDRVEKFIGGLHDNIQGNVIVVEPIRLQDAVRIANNLMDQKLKGYAVKNAENKRSNEKKGYDGPLPYCNKCKLHHEGPCNVKCGKCNKEKTDEAKGKACVLGGGKANPDSKAEVAT